MGVRRRRVDGEVARAAQLVPAEKVRALRVEEERHLLRLQRVTRLAYLRRSGVFGDGHEGHVFCYEEAAHAHKVKVARHEEERLCRADRRGHGGEQRGQQGLGGATEHGLGQRDAGVRSARVERCDRGSNIKKPKTQNLRSPKTWFVYTFSTAHYSTYSNT